MVRSRNGLCVLAAALGVAWLRPAIRWRMAGSEAAPLASPKASQASEQGSVVA